DLELPVHDREPVADVRAGALAGDRVHRVRAERMLDRRARGAVAERLVDPRRVEREALADARVVDGDARVLADEILLGVGNADVADDGVQYTAPRDRRLAPLGFQKRVAQILRDVLERPNIE